MQEGFAAVLVLSMAVGAVAEQVTVTTYYPAPTGIYNQMVTTAQTLLARDGGDVGIGLGATAPGAKLDILSDATLTPLQVKGGGNAGVDIARFYNSGGTEVMRINNAGRVGIGTNAPAALLDVAGTSRATNLQVTNVATAGAACSPNGLIAQDNTGGLLSCKSAVWTAASGGGGGTGLKTYVGVTPGAYNGSAVGGYAGGNAKCAAAYAGARMCLGADFVNGYPAASGWYSTVVLGQDCTAWTSTAFSSGYWNGTAAQSSLCNVARVILCCK